jgi:PAS domain S-box-containing protein
MKRSSAVISLPFVRYIGPGLATIQAILDLLPYSALLVDTYSDRIVAANSKATELTAFTRAELNDINLPKLFPEWEWKASTETDNGRAEESTDDDKDARWTIARRNRPNESIYVTPTRLSDRWILLALESLQERDIQKQELGRREKYFEMHRLVASSLQQTDMDMALRLVIEAGSIILGASHLAIYQADGESLVLNRCELQGSEDIFPDHIQSNDLITLNQPSLWVPGKRPISRLQRAARAGGMAFMASTPLGQPKARIGILAVAGEYPSTAELAMEFLPIMAGTVTAILDNHTLTKYLKKHLKDQTIQLLINSAIKNSVMDGIILIAPDLTIQEMNPSAEVILGYTNEEVRGQPYQNILVTIENLTQAFSSDLDSSEAFDLGNIKLYRRDGSPFLAHVRKLPIYEDNQLVCHVAIVQDLSEEEQIRQRSQQLEQRASLGEITAVFAHEVRNPINNISTGLQLMAMNIPDDDPNHDVIARLQVDCDRLAELMRSVLNFVKPIEYKYEPVDVGQSLQRLLERMRPRMTNVGIKHQLQIDADVPPVEGDLRALEQVWTNLVNNALQAMGEDGGTLTIKVRKATAADDTPRVEIIVSDTGPGIPEDIHDRIFEPFFTTKRYGTGLGLSITKHIVTAHKGTITPISVPGATAFQVILPVAHQNT